MPSTKEAITYSTRASTVVLGRWRHALQALAVREPLDTNRCGPLHSLAAWYERICADDRYTSRAPRDGIEALATLEPSPDPDSRELLMRAKWAVRVAQELVECRRLLAGEQTSRGEEMALNRLEVAMLGKASTVGIRPAS